MLKNLLENVFRLNQGRENNFNCINIYCEVISLKGNKKGEGKKKKLKSNWLLQKSNIK